MIQCPYRRTIDELRIKHRLPPFHGLILCGTGLGEAERDEVERMCISPRLWSVFVERRDRKPSIIIAYFFCVDACYLLIAALPPIAHYYAIS